MHQKIFSINNIEWLCWAYFLSSFSEIRGKTILWSKFTLCQDWATETRMSFLKHFVMIILFQPFFGPLWEFCSRSFQSQNIFSFLIKSIRRDFFNILKMKYMKANTKLSSQKTFRGWPNISVGQPILVQPKYNPTYLSILLL